MKLDINVCITSKDVFIGVSFGFPIFSIKIGLLFYKVRDKAVKTHNNLNLQTQIYTLFTN
jgi:hypothetical protein